MLSGLKTLDKLTGSVGKVIGNKTKKGIKSGMFKAPKRRNTGKKSKR